MDINKCNKTSWSSSIDVDMKRFDIEKIKNIFISRYRIQLKHTIDDKANV